eukprot:gene15303-41319_t
MANAPSPMMRYTEGGDAEAVSAVCREEHPLECAFVADIDWRLFVDES